MRKFLVGASAAAVLALTAACTTSTAPADHNADDIAFAQGMIPHHAQAVEMARIVPSRTTNPRLLDIATRIQQAQDPEIQQLTTMLTQWGSAPASTRDMDHGTMSHLEPGPGFDRMWAQMMIDHHKGAIDMARTELSKGANPDAKSLAQKIVDAQQTEITELQSMLT